MGFETPNFGLYNLKKRVHNANFRVRDVKFGVIQPKKWGCRRIFWRSGRKIWGYTTPKMGLF